MVNDFGSPEEPSPRSWAAVGVARVTATATVVEMDQLAVEEPLEIRLRCDYGGQRVHRSISITMRTPGHDSELAVGFLFTEGIVSDPSHLVTVHACGGGNTACVTLRRGVEVDLSRLERHFYASSSCGVCGKASLDAVRVQVKHHLDSSRPVIVASVIHCLPELLRSAQAVFDRTGGLHASALFDVHGQLLALREDVGRHNALDKLIGREFLAGRVPLLDRVLLVSGRVSFELVQKAAMAGIGLLAGVGAPSSLAVSLAEEHGMTILGFVRDGRFNIYSGSQRVRNISTPTHLVIASGRPYRRRAP